MQRPERWNLMLRVHAATPWKLDTPWKPLECWNPMDVFALVSVEPLRAPRANAAKQGRGILDRIAERLSCGLLRSHTKRVGGSSSPPPPVRFFRATSCAASRGRGLSLVPGSP